MKLLYLDLGMGAAGDMLTAALYELLDDNEKAEFITKMNSLGIDGVSVTARPCEKCGITGTHIEVSVHGAVEGEHDHGHSHDHHHEHEHHDVGDGDDAAVCQLEAEAEVGHQAHQRGAHERAGQCRTDVQDIGKGREAQNVGIGPEHPEENEVEKEQHAQCHQDICTYCRNLCRRVP